RGPPGRGHADRGRRLRRPRPGRLQSGGALRAEPDADRGGRGRRPRLSGHAGAARPPPRARAVLAPGHASLRAGGRERGDANRARGPGGDEGRPGARALIEAVVIGRVGIDLYPNQLETPLSEVRTYTRYVGGFAGNVVTGLARLGVRVAI